MKENIIQNESHPGLSLKYKMIPAKSLKLGCISKQQCSTIAEPLFICFYQCHSLVLIFSHAEKVTARIIHKFALKTLKPEGALALLLHTRLSIDKIDPLCFFTDG